MNNSEKEMLELLNDLRENHHVVGIKAEFEAEGSRIEEVIKLKEIITEANLDLTVKIGGCEAIRDLYEVKEIGVKSIVAPMIESPYALYKFTQAIKTVFSKNELDKINFLINIETITGFNNFNQILENESSKSISGIVFGRSDMAGSLGLNKDEVNSKKMLEFAKIIAEKTKQYKKELIIGGGVSSLSLPFFKQVSPECLCKFETRKVIFDAQKVLNSQNPEETIAKAVRFELLWIKNKRDFYGQVLKEDAQRLEMLKSLL